MKRRKVPKRSPENEQLKKIKQLKRARKKLKAKGTFIEKDVLLSLAYAELTAAQIRVYNIFLLKRKMAKDGGTKKGKREKWRCANNGEIVFTYREAESFGFTHQTFANAITKLVKVGLIDISYQGDGLKKGDFSKYGLSNRWQRYGMPDFVQKLREKDQRVSGYAK